MSSVTAIPSTPAAPLFATTRRYASHMLLRSTTHSISVRSSDFVCSPLAAHASAPAHALPAFRAVRSRRAALASASASSACIEIGRPTLGVAGSGLRPCGLLCPLLTSGGASRRLSTPVAQRHAARSPRVLRTYLHAYARRIYAVAFRTRIGLCMFWPACPACVASYPLPVRRASALPSGFLPIRGRPRHRCLQLTLPRVGCVEDFHLLVSAPCRAHQKQRARDAGPFFASVGLATGVAPTCQPGKAEQTDTQQNQRTWLGDRDCRRVVEINVRQVKGLVVVRVRRRVTNRRNSDRRGC